MRELAVLTVASHIDRGFLDFMFSCERFGITPIVMGYGKHLRGHSEKVQMLHDILRKLEETYENVLMTDCFDAIFTASPNQIISEFKHLNHPLVFSSERICFPYPELSPKHPHCDSPYRFLNSGGIIGNIKYFIDVLDYLKPQEWRMDVSDQGYYMKFFCENHSAIKLDTQCRIFQCLFDSHRDLEYGQAVYNRLTQSNPCIIHGNGACDMSEPLSWLKRAR